MDMNDRALRDIVIGLGGTGNGVPREDGFDITVASEVMAIFCLATSFEDLKKRLGDIVRGPSPRQAAGHRRDLKAAGAMTVLLKDAIAQPGADLENNPAFVHGGPFANIAHGCNSVIATAMGAEAGRLRGDRGRLRRRPGRREVLRHQVPQGRPEARRRGHRGHRARAEDARRRRQGRPRAREPRGAQAPASSTSSRHVENVAQVRRAGRRRHQPLHHRHGPSTGWSPTSAASEFGAEAVQSAATGPRAAPARKSSPARSCRAVRGRHRRTSSRSTRTACRSREKIAPSPPEIYRADDIAIAPRPRPPEGLRGRRLRPPAGLHGQDAVFLLRPTRPCSAPRPAASCRCARCASPPAPASSSPSAARS
jgi:hypothetical protein